jgi:hypothetical protein
MNDKIYAVACEADVMARKEVPDLREIPMYNRVRDKMFAELLIQQCADLAYSQSIYCRGVPWNQVIKQHFDLEITATDLAPYFRTAT